MKEFSIGTLVTVKKTKYKAKKVAQPYLPDLAGKVGTVSKVVHKEVPIPEEEQDDTGSETATILGYYVVEFEDPFPVGVKPEGSDNLKFTPKEFTTASEWEFTQEELMKKKKEVKE